MYRSMQARNGSALMAVPTRSSGRTAPSRIARTSSTVEVEALSADPAPVDAVTVPAIVEHLERVLRDLPSPLILIGHSAGGAFTEILMDRGYGAAGVALNSAPTEGVPVVPLSQIRSTFEVLKNPANRHRAVRYDFARRNYAFTNTFPQDEAGALYERYAVPVPGRILVETALANLTPAMAAPGGLPQRAARTPAVRGSTPDGQSSQRRCRTFLATATGGT